MGHKIHYTKGRHRHTLEFTDAVPVDTVMARAGKLRASGALFVTIEKAKIPTQRTPDTDAD